MHIWIDLGNSPHVPFFKALAPELESRGHRVSWTARDYAQTIQLAEAAGIEFKTVGSHGGGNLFKKGIHFIARTGRLFEWARTQRFDLLLSHNSHEPLMVARLLGVTSVNLMDYEHHPMNHLSFRLASKVIVPESFPESSIKRFGATKKTLRFSGIKEDVYLSDFTVDASFRDTLSSLGVGLQDCLIVVRPHAPEALYHRGVVNEVLDALLTKLAARKDTKVILLPRKRYQGDEIRKRHPSPNIIIPNKPLNGSQLLAVADYVFSGGGTMNREVAALGTPTATIFAGESAAVDRYLESEGRLIAINKKEDLEKIQIGKKSVLEVRRRPEVKQQVIDGILGSRHR